MNAQIKELNITHLPDVQELQNKIFDNLHEDEKHFILKRSAEDFIKALGGENTHMLGVFQENKLIAQCIFAMPQNELSRDMPEFLPDVQNQDLVIYKAVAVDPNFRGTNLMKKMLDHIEKSAKEMGKKTSIIQIAIDNPASWINALRNGMAIKKVDKDPEDGVKVLYLQKDFDKSTQSTGQEFHMTIGKDIHTQIPFLYNRMQYRIEKGFSGMSLEKTAGNYKLVWHKTHDSSKNLVKINHLQQKLGINAIL